MKAGDEIYVNDGSKKIGLVTLVEAKKGFRGLYNYQEVYVLFPDGEKNVYLSWMVRKVKLDD